jgi:hypothetical protein
LNVVIKRSRFLDGGGGGDDADGNSLHAVNYFLRDRERDNKNPIRVISVKSLSKQFHFNALSLALLVPLIFFSLPSHSLAAAAVFVCFHFQ